MSAAPGTHGTPPASNPVLTAYESFVKDTPLVTRNTLTTASISFLLSFFVDLTFAFANIPLFTLQRLELYRIVLAPFICNNVISLIFAFISFLAQGKRLEFAMGSTSFAALILTIGVLTNIAFLLFYTLLYFLSGNAFWLTPGSVGIWTMLMGIISLECSTAPPDSKRRLFAFEVPALYYPFVLLAFFTLLGGLDMSYVISVGIGYAYGYGKLNKLKLGYERRRKWEAGILKKFTEREGWVVGPSSNDWNLGITPTLGQGLSADLPAPANVIKKKEKAAEPFIGSGQVLGSPVQRRSQSTTPVDRSAMLAAAERRAASASASSTNEVDEEKGV